MRKQLYSYYPSGPRPFAIQPRSRLALATPRNLALAPTAQLPNPNPNPEQVRLQHQERRYLPAPLRAHRDQRAREGH